MSAPDHARLLLLQRFRLRRRGRPHRRFRSGRTRIARPTGFGCGGKPFIVGSAKRFDYRGLMERRHMKRLLTRLGTVLLATTVLTVPQLASAQSRRDYRDSRPSYNEPDRRKHNHDNDAVVGAVAGLVIGAIIGSALSSHDPGDRGYSDDGYYPDSRYGAGAYPDARVTEWHESPRYAGYDQRTYGRPRRDEDCDDDDRRGRHGRGHEGRRGRHDDWDN
jgi:hypothetical protein